MESQLKITSSLVNSFLIINLSVLKLVHKIFKQAFLAKIYYSFQAATEVESQLDRCENCSILLI